MAYKLNGVNTGGIPMYLLKPILDKYDVLYCVETGTASGDSAREAAKHFKKVWTIELIESRQERSNAPKNLEFLEGDSTKWLLEIIPNIKLLQQGKETKYCVFYLDAHYSDIKPNETEFPECPVLREIEIVSEYGQDAIIIIDDARLFFGNPPYPHDPREWPSIIEVFSLLKKKFEYHHITITDDYILAVPLQVRDVIDKEWRERFHIRYPNDEDKLKGQMRDVYVHLKNKFNEFIKTIEE